MLTQTEENTVLEKTRELCTTILEQPNMGVIRQNIESFLANTEAREQYETLMNKGQALHEKQHGAQPLGGEEIADFERQRELVLGNPVARGFLDAQQALHRLQETIHKHLSKTLETGRLPTPEDLHESCGDGCGCSH
jgi:cell fate (sporulation/competence/biofilm development) regulator YlbF (YheA/YmcA/DUF963 family)